jgi:hypothetical protein
MRVAKARPKQAHANTTTTSTFQTGIRLSCGTGKGSPEWTSRACLEVGPARRSALRIGVCYHSCVSFTTMWRCIQRGHSTSSLFRWHRPVNRTISRKSLRSGPTRAQFRATWCVKVERITQSSLAGAAAADRTLAEPICGPGPVPHLARPCPAASRNRRPRRSRRGGPSARRAPEGGVAAPTGLDHSADFGRAVQTKLIVSNSQMSSNRHLLVMSLSQTTAGRGKFGQRAQLGTRARRGRVGVPGVLY